MYVYVYTSTCMSAAVLRLAPRQNSQQCPLRVAVLYYSRYAIFILILDETRRD